MPANGEQKTIAMRGVEALSTMVTDNERLISENDRLKTDVAIMRERCNQLEGRLETSTTTCDHYMRFASTLVAKLNDIQLIIADAIKSSKHAAFAPPPVPTPKPKLTAVDLTDTDKLQSLVQRLNGGDGDAAKA